MSNDEHFIRFPPLLRDDTHIARFAGDNQSPGSPTPERSGYLPLSALGTLSAPLVLEFWGPAFL
jgi:hypothetical protein